MNVFRSTIETAQEERFKDNKTIQRLLTGLAEAEHPIRLHLKSDPHLAIRNYVHGLDGEEGFDPTMFGGGTSNLGIDRMVEHYARIRVWTELFGLLVAELNDLGEDIDY